MLKVLLFVALGIISTQARANSSSQMENDENQVRFDTAYCSVYAENYSRGELSDRGMSVNNVYSEVFTIIPGQKYSVLVTTELYQDSLAGDGPEIGFNCFRCPDTKLVVTKESYENACKDKK